MHLRKLSQKKPFLVQYRHQDPLALGHRYIHIPCINKTSLFFSPYFPCVILNFGAWPHEVFESSGVKLKNGLEIGIKTMVLAAGSSQ